jgi:hypothetical protein
MRGFYFRNSNSAGMIAADCTGGGRILFDTCGFFPGNDTGAGYIAVLDNSGQAILHNCEVASGGHSLVISGEQQAARFTVEAGCSTLRGQIFSTATQVM